MNGSFNMNNDIQDEIEFLFTNPEALVLLCFLGNTLHERTPSRNIMDRGMECMKLQKRGLTRQIAEKHLHRRPCSITKYGEEVLAHLIEMGIPEQIYENCNLSDRNQFISDMEIIIENYIKSTKKVPDLWFLDGIPFIGVEFQRNSARGLISFKIEDIENLGNTRVLIKVWITCPRCRNRDLFKYEIEELDPLKYHEYTCSSCALYLNLSHDLRYIY